MEVSTEIANRYLKWVDKKAASKPAPVAKMMKRTNGTAMAVLTELDGIPFQELSSSLYFICQDLKAEEFVHRYESQLELAGANHDAFVKGLHKFFNDTARFIKDNDLFAEFFEFVSLCNRMRYEDRWNEHGSTRRKVMDCYQSLLMQNLEYMRPNKFDFSTVVCGLDSRGELMVAPDAYPDIDEVIRKIEQMFKQDNLDKVRFPTMDSIIKYCFKDKYPEIDSMDTLNEAMELDRIFTHHHAAMATFLNEFNFDILPDAAKPITRSTLPFFAIQHRGVDVTEIEQSLQRRARTLPSNGVIFKFQYGGVQLEDSISEVLMREVQHDDHIFMLYKLTLNGGETCGFYDTHDKFLYSILQEAPISEPYEHLRALLLYLYACATTRNGESMLAELGSKFFLGENELSSPNPVLKMTVTASGRGGKLFRTYKPELDKDDRKHTGPRAGNEKYEATDKSIMGFVRKVGEGRHPSKEAIERAEALGYDLAPDETYVQPFVKKVLRLRRRMDQQNR